MKIEAYLFFDGNCEEAFEFYKSVLGGEFDRKNYFHEGPMDIPEEMKNKIMHISLNLGDVVLMGSDGLQGQKGDNFSLSFYSDDPKEMEEMFNKMAEGGTITSPLENQFWGSKFGMLKDKFGINWMFSSPAEEGK